MGRALRRGVASVAMAGVVASVLAAQAAGAATSGRGHDSASPATTTSAASHSSSPLASSGSGGRSGSSSSSGSSTTTTTEAGSAPTENPASDAVVPNFGPSTSFALDQAWMLSALGDRESRLSELASAISASKTLQSSDASSLSSLVSAATSTCSALQTSVSGATTVAQLRLAAEQMIGSLHVYAIVTPQVDLTIDAEAVANAASALAALEPGLNTAIAAAHTSKRMMDRLHTLEQTLATDAGAASNLVGPLPGQLVPLSDANLSAAMPVISSATGADTRARSQVLAANTALQRLLNLLAGTGVSSHVRVKLKALDSASKAASRSLVADLHR